MTIPVRQESLNQKICDVKTSLSNWAEKHWLTLVTNYSKAACFQEMKQPIESFYSDVKTEFLSEINQQAIMLINKLMNIKTVITSTHQYKLIEGKSERLVDLVLQAGGTEYVSGPAAKNYLDENLFREAGIKITWMDYKGYKEYWQLFPPFEHAVSIVDLLFNEGKDAKSFLKITQT
jgi:hypothetical protein